MAGESSLNIKETKEFSRWYNKLNDINQTKVDARLDLIVAGIIKKSKSLGAGLFELKWKSGMRVR